MKLMIKKLSLFAFIGLLFLAIAGCTTTTTTVSELTDTEKVAAVLDGIDLGNLTAVTANLTLPTTVDGVTLSWSSANINVLSNAGAIVVPTYTTGDVTVVLTVTATLNDVTDSKTFSVTVSKETVSAFLTRAGNSIIINGADAVTGNLNLPATVLGATVTWESSNTEMVSIAATAVDGFYVATVTRPQADDGGVNTSAQLTATVSIDDQEIEVVKTILVLAESASTHVTSIAEGLSYALGTYITWEGMTILGVGTDGFYFTDGTDVMFVYNTAVAATVEEGEVYDVTGGISLYNSIPEVQNLGTNVVKVKASTVAARDITPVVATIDEIIANHTGYTAENPMEFGVYSVTAKVYYDQALGNYGTYLVLNDATGLDKAHAIRIYYKSNMTAVSALAGQTVTLDIVMFGYNSGASYLDWYAYFFGTTEDIEVTFANDQDAVDAAFNALTIPAAIIEGTTLDLPASLFGVTLSYASDNTTVVNPTTGVVDLSSLTGQETVTLTVTGTRGSVTDSTTFEIVVGETPLSTIAEVLAMNTTTGLIAKVQGTVYAIYQTGYFIFDETGLFQVYTTPTGLSLGDEVVVSGTVAAYKGEVQFTSATVEETVSTGNDYAQTPELFIPGVTQLVAGQTYNTVGTVFWGKATETGYDNLYIKSAADTFMFQIYYKSVQTEYDALKAMAGQTVSLNFVYYNNKAASNPADISTIYSGGAVAATDADKVAADKEALEIETDQVSGAEATLPLVGTFGSVVTWDVTALTGATYDSVTGVLTYPTVTVDTDFTLTATITSGSASDTLAITVSVRAVTDEEKLVEAQTALTIALTANEYDTVTLPTEGLNGVAIVWTISSGDAVLTDADLFFNMTGAAYDVTMLATLTLGTEADLTKEFTIAVSPITVITDLSLLTAKSGDPLVWTIANGTSVYVQGVVTGLVYDGVFIQDANGNGFFMYRPVGTVVVGDEIVAKGTLADYRSARQLGNGGIIKTILTSENVVTSETLTLDQVIALTYADAGSVFTVTGLEVYSYTSSTVIFRVNGTSSVQYLRLYYNDWASWLDEVYPVGSFLPEVQFNMYNIYTTNIANPGDTFNIDNFLIEVTDEQLITVALASLTLPTAITEGTTLTLPASYAGVAFTYASDNEAVINSTTGVVDLSGLTTQVTVTLTVTATYGAGSDTATFAIKVGTIPLSTVAEAIALADDAVFRIQGILTAQTKSTAFWIEDATGGLNIYAATTDVQNQLIPLIGQEVELIGTKDSYNGLQEIVNITSVVVINATPTAIVPADVSAVAFDSTGLLPYQGELVSFQGFILKYTVTATSGSVNFVLVNPVTGEEITARLESTLPTYADTLAQIKTFVAGDAIDVVGAVIGWYNGPQIAVVGASNFVAGTEITDQVMADYELTKVSLPTTPVTADFTLDVAGLFGATVEWASDNAAIAVTGSAATVTRPANGVGDATVTLTYTVTYGTASASDTVVITVTEEAAGPVETVAYSTGFEAADGFVATTSYNNTTVLFTGEATHQWGTYYGTPSTTSPIADLQSLQMRYYTTAPENYGYTYTNFTVADVTKVVFSAKNYANVADVTVSYSTDGGTTWTVAQVIDLTTTATEYTVNINSTGNTMIKFELSGTTVAERLTIDSVSIFNIQ
ncbi:MAG: hypothetical protein KKE16_05960 [Firmicutes bacterium]|nr:hypothetical protein [Bacillota bacterium]